MQVRELNHRDLRSLVEFIVDAYYDYPMATWFDKEPTPEQIEGIFYNKLHGIASRNLIDVVTEDGGSISAECEIARTSFDSGVVGILVRHGYRGKRIGSEMLEKAIDDAAKIGMVRFAAEVDEKNAGALKFFARNKFTPIGYRDARRAGEMHRIVILQRSVS